jgi:hypothetical protein
MPFEVGEEVMFRPKANEVVEGIVVDVGWYRCGGALGAALGRLLRVCVCVCVCVCVRVCACTYAVQWRLCRL